MDQNVCTITIGDQPKKGIPNFTAENCRFFGRPNFAGEEDRFRDARRKFTLIIPEEAKVPLQELGYNVKTTVPTDEDLAEGREPINHLKVMVDPSSDVWIIMGDQREKLNENTMGILDRSKIDELDMEIRAWNYNEKEVQAGLEEPAYSARLVTLVAVLRPNRLQQKYGSL